MSQSLPLPSWAFALSTSSSSTVISRDATNPGNPPGLWPSLLRAGRVSRFISSSSLTAAECGEGVMGGGGGATLHGGMGMSLTTQAGMDLLPKLSQGKTWRLVSSQVDYKGPVPLPGWLKIDAKMVKLDMEASKAETEAMIVNPEDGKLLVRTMCKWTVSDVVTVTTKPVPAPRTELPKGAQQLQARFPKDNYAWAGDAPMVVSNLTSPSPSYKFDHPAKIAFIWKTVYGLGQMERSYEASSRAMGGDMWYEFVNEGGCMSPGGKGPVHPGVLFSITDFSMSSMARTAGDGLTVTATLTLDYTPAASKFSSGWLHMTHTCSKVDGRKVFLETVVTDAMGEVLLSGKGLWIITGPLPKI